MDNGSDFRSKDLRNFARAYNINLHFRPMGGPQYGAHVERFLGTLNNRLHNLPGTTFSNVKEKEDYQSDERATYTIDELEARVVTELVRYHDDLHNGIKSTPLSLWKKSLDERSILQTNNLHLPSDMERFKLDILPSEKRTVQRQGIQLFNMNFNSEELSRWILSKDPKDARKSRKFIVRYDPRDMRHVYFYDPEDKKYLKIRNNDSLIDRYFKDRPISLWEIKNAQSETKSHGIRNVKTKQTLKIVSGQQEMDKATRKRNMSARQRQEKQRHRIRMTYQQLRRN